MSDNITNTFDSFKKIVNNNNFPSDIQSIINNFNTNNSDSNQNLSNLLSQISPEMLNNFSSLLQSNNVDNSNSASNSSSSDEASNTNFNIDSQTLMKMTSIIAAMNKTENPGSNLLHSLKPYLRDSRKNKLDQYANLLNLSKIADVLKNDKKGGS